MNRHQNRFTDEGAPDAITNPEALFERYPHDVGVDVEISMGDAIAHPSHAAPRNVGIVRYEFTILVHHPGGGLADDDEAHHDRLLRSLIGKEILLARSVDEAARIVRGISI